jgi:hypothetical protein
MSLKTDVIFSFRDWLARLARRAQESSNLTAKLNTQRASIKHQASDTPAGAPSLASERAGRGRDRIPFEILGGVWRAGDPTL